MSPAPLAEPLLSLVLARLGALHLAVPSAWVAGACLSDTPPATLPRRQGAVAGLLSTAQGCVPVVDLARWVTLPEATSPLPAARADQPACYLTLHQGGQRLALQVDELLGLRRVPAARVQRVHHRDDPEELFDAVLPGTSPGDPTVCVLEPQRLMRLLSLWCDDATKCSTDPTHGPTAHTPRAARLALVRAAGQRLAVDMRHVAELMPLPALKTRLAPGGASAGFADWRGGSLAMLNAGRLQGQTAASAAPLALVLSDDGGRAIALPVDELLGIAPLPPDTVPADPGDAAWRGDRWTDADGPVEQLRVPALLDALPESALAQRGARTASDSRLRNGRPYFVLQAGRTAALPIDDVLAVVESGSVAHDQQTLDWRGRQLPLRGQPSAGGCRRRATGRRRRRGAARGAAAGPRARRRGRGECPARRARRPHAAPAVAGRQLRRCQRRGVAPRLKGPSARLSAGRPAASITFVITSGNPMSALKLTQIGNSVGVILPKEVLARLKVEKGDVLYLTEAANGVTLTPYDPGVEAQIEAGREFMRDFRDTFHQLAK